MKKSTITKGKTLEGQLLEMQESTLRFIPFRAYTEMHVRKVVRKLNNSGHTFEASTANVLDGISVTKLK